MADPRPRAPFATILSAVFGGGTLLLALIGWAEWRGEFMTSLRQGFAEWIAPAPVGAEWERGSANPRLGVGEPSNGAETDELSAEEVAHLRDVAEYVINRCVHGQLITMIGKRPWDVCKLQADGEASNEGYDFEASNAVRAKGSDKSPIAQLNTQPSGLDLFVAQQCKKGPVIEKTTGVNLCRWLNGREINVSPREGSATR